MTPAERAKKFINGFPDGWGFRLVMVYCVLSATFSVILSVYVAFSPGKVAPPVIEFDKESLTPEKDVLCPGEYLKFTYTSTLVQAPAIITIAYSWWSVDNQNTAVFGSDELFSIRNTTGTMTKEMSIPIPDMPPGKYEFRFGSAESQTLPDVLAVPFSIPSNCSATPTPQASLQFDQKLFSSYNVAQGEK